MLILWNASISIVNTARLSKGALCVSGLISSNMLIFCIKSTDLKADFTDLRIVLISCTIISLKICHERLVVFSFLHEFLEVKWKQILYLNKIGERLTTSRCEFLF